MNDETLEKVSGGGDEADDMNRIISFERKNCYSCYRQVFRTCPYGSGEDAFVALGSSIYAVCPDKERI